MPKGGEAVHAANPEVLVILSGIDYDTNLSFLRDRFFNVSFTDKLVFEQHWYSFSDGRDSWVKHNSNDLCAKIIEKVTHNGGFLIGRGFPLFLTEFALVKICRIATTKPWLYSLKSWLYKKIATLMDRKKNVAIASWLEKTVAIRGY